jgi:hypothetical protein
VYGRVKAEQGHDCPDVVPVKVAQESACRERGPARVAPASAGLPAIGERFLSVIRI